MFWSVLAGLLVSAFATGALSQRSVNGTTVTPTSATSEPPPLSFTLWLSQYWYVLLIVVVLLVVVSVLICACVIHRQSRASVSLDQDNKSYPNPPWDRSDRPQHSPHRSLPVTNSSSLSEDSTPVPSHSSFHSVRLHGHSRRPSSRLPSEMGDTIKPDSRSDSSGGSSASLMGRNSRGLDYQRSKPMARRTLSSPVIQVPRMVPEGQSALYPASSTLSVGSSTSGHSGLSYRFHGNSEGGAVIEVGVTVHTPGDPDKAVSVTTAAALAESAKKLAQEAASFIDEEQETRVWQHRHIPSHTPLRQSYSGSSSRASCRSLPPHILPHSGQLATASLDIPHRGSRGRRRTEQEDEDEEFRMSTTSSSLSSHMHEHDSAYHSSSQRPTRSSLQSIQHPRLSSQPYLRRERYALNRHDLSRTSLDYDVTSSRAPSCDIPRHSYANHNQSYLQSTYSRKHSVDGATPVIRSSDVQPLYTRKHSYDGIVPVIRGTERSHYAKSDMDGLSRKRELTRERNIVTHLEEEPLEHRHSTASAVETDVQTVHLDKYPRDAGQPGDRNHLPLQRLVREINLNPHTTASLNSYPTRPNKRTVTTESMEHTEMTTTEQHQSLEQPHYESNDSFCPTADDKLTAGDHVNITTIHV